MIRVTEETRDGWRVLTVSGRADAEAADALEATLRSAVEKHAQVVADFVALDYISSAGLRAVLQAARAAQNRGSEFALCRLTGHVRKVFDMSGLYNVLHIREELPC